MSSCHTSSREATLGRPPKDGAPDPDAVGVPTPGRTGWPDARDTRAAGIVHVRQRFPRWPYGADYPTAATRLVAWAEANDLVLYDPYDPQARCLHWLIGHGRRCAQLRRYHPLPHPGFLADWPTFDHVTCWADRATKRPAVILMQPYAIEGARLAAIEAEWPVDIEVTESAPWYCHTGTYGIFIRPRGGAR